MFDESFVSINGEVVEEFYLLKGEIVKSFVLGDKDEFGKLWHPPVKYTVPHTIDKW